VRISLTTAEPALLTAECRRSRSRTADLNLITSRVIFVTVVIRHLLVRERASCSAQDGAASLEIKRACSLGVTFFGRAIF